MPLYGAYNASALSRWEIEAEISAELPDDRTASPHVAENETRER